MLKNTMKYCLILSFACSLSFTHVLAQAPPQTDVPDDAVVAKVDGKPVTAGEIRKSLMIMPKEFVQLFNQNPKYAVQQLYMLRYLADEAERTKLGDESPMKEQLEFLRQPRPAVVALLRRRLVLRRRAAHRRRHPRVVQPHAVVA